MNRRAALPILFFIYGGLVHLFILRWYVHEYYTHTENAFVNHILTNLSLIALGGVSFAVAMFCVSRSSSGLPAPKKRVLLLRGGLYGLLATASSLEAFFVLASAYLSLSERFRPSATSSFWVFTSLFVSMQTYGMDIIIKSSPLAFAFGMGGAVLIAWIHQREPNL